MIYQCCICDAEMDATEYYDQEGICSRCEQDEYYDDYSDIEGNDL